MLNYYCRRHSGHHDRERFIDLEEIDVSETHSSFGKHLLRRGNGRIQHQGWAATHICRGDDPRTWLETVILRKVRGGQQERRCSNKLAGHRFCHHLCALSGSR